MQKGTPKSMFLAQKFARGPLAPERGVLGSGAESVCAYVFMQRAPAQQVFDSLLNEYNFRVISTHPRLVEIKDFISDEEADMLVRFVLCML